MTSREQIVYRVRVQYGYDMAWYKVVVVPPHVPWKFGVFGTFVAVQEMTATTRTCTFGNSSSMSA